MILQIRSENPKLLDLLYKNPGTDQGLYAKPLKNGIIIGNAVNANQYDVIFQDTKYSYLPEESNTIDFQSYCSPLTVLNMCTELFMHILRDKEEYQNAPITWLNSTQGQEDSYPCELFIPTFYIHSSWYRNDEFLLERYFPALKVKQVIGHNFELRIQADSVFEAINLLNVVSVFTHVTNEYGKFIYIDEQFASKYVRILTNIEKVPYFIFYLFIKRAVKNDKQFQLVKPIFENYLSKQGLETSLSYNGTHLERVKYISSKLDLQTSILDIGCGEFIYYKRMMNLGFRKTYYAIDEDERFEKLGEAISKRYEENNLQFYTQLNECKINEKVNIILTEVIEHNSIEDATRLVQQAAGFNFDLMIITTPNVSFNQFYAENAGSRHDDHQFELNETEFVSFIQNCFSQEPAVDIRYEYIGDKINGIQPTQIALITHNK